MPRYHSLFALGLVVSLPGTALAYDVATSSSGAPLHWDAEQIVFTLALDPSPAEVALAESVQAATDAAATWQTALAASMIDVAIAADPVAAAPHVTDGVNTIRWAVAADDPDLEPGLLARTFLAYRPGDGVLVDADVVLDGTGFTWTTDPTGCSDEYDVESALTHELGHALGLAHSKGHREATMFATGDACDTGKRDLDADDRAGLDELYATPAEAPGCSSTGATSSLGPCILIVAGLLARRRRGVAGAGIVIGLVIAAVPAAEAAQLRRLELATLGDEARLVVRGHVVATAAVREGERGLETDSTVVVDECLAGSCPQSLEVRRHGGELDDVGLWVDGEATLDVGDEVVLYLRLDRSGHARVLGGVQGLLRVERASGRVLAVRDLRGNQLRVDDGWEAGEREIADLADLRAALRQRDRD